MGAYTASGTPAVHLGQGSQSRSFFCSEGIAKDTDTLLKDSALGVWLTWFLSQFQNFPVTGP